MEDLDKVIDALERCLDGDDACPGCYLHDYDGCRDKLNHDALDYLTVYRDFLRRCGEGGELIRRSDVLKFPIRRDHYDREHGNPHFINGIETVMEYVEFIPPVESEPVVHARWRWGRNSMNQYGAWCTECECGWEDKGNDFDRVQGLVIAHKYCPNCGAHMDENLEIRTCYCPICHKHFSIRSNDSMGSCPDCGHHVVLHREGEE